MRSVNHDLTRQPDLVKTGKEEKEDNIIGYNSFQSIHLHHFFIVIHFIIVKGQLPVELKVYGVYFAEALHCDPDILIHVLTSRALEAQDRDTHPSTLFV